ncbi:MAG: carbohydrate deacetylase [Streptococcaceae bacterium]|jgi:predicted glycoside hydrolase/deacetylase ChbG (UPF0249 family)|nr:carbohydrate deacetylase [Streptococcaceae bacterium]
MPLLIINADDFGYGPGINLGIIESHKNGILTSTTLMANMPGFDHAVELAKENPKLGIGVHLVLTCDKPLLNNVPSLVDEKGNFKHLSFYEQEFFVDLDELYQEWKAQIDKVIDAGIDPTHLDSHHHVNSIYPLSTVFERLAKEYSLPVRGNYNVSEDLTTTRRFFTMLDGIALEKEIWKPMSVGTLVDDVLTFDTLEAMCHPGFVDAELLDRSSFTNGRPYQVRELTKPYYQELFAQKGITLGTFRDLELYLTTGQLKKEAVV